MLSEEEQNIINSVPVEFKAVLNYMAIEKSHHAGKEETENTLLSLSCDLLPCILTFEKSVISRTIQAIKRGDIKL